MTELQRYATRSKDPVTFNTLKADVRGAVFISSGK